MLSEEDHADNYGVPGQLKNWYALQDYDEKNHVVNKVVGYGLVNYQKCVFVTFSLAFTICMNAQNVRPDNDSSLQSTPVRQRV